MRLDIIRLDDVLQAVRDNPGLNSTEIAEIVTGVPMSSLDRTKRVSILSSMGYRSAYRFSEPYSPRCTAPDRPNAPLWIFKKSLQTT